MEGKEIWIVGGEYGGGEQVSRGQYLTRAITTTTAAAAIVDLALALILMMAGGESLEERELIVEL